MLAYFESEHGNWCYLPWENRGKAESVTAQVVHFITSIGKCKLCYIRLSPEKSPFRSLSNLIKGIPALVILAPNGTIIKNEACGEVDRVITVKRTIVEQSFKMLRFQGEIAPAQLLAKWCQKWEKKALAAVDVTSYETCNDRKSYFQNPYGEQKIAIAENDD